MKLYIDIDRAPSGLVTSTVNTALVKAQPVFVQGDTLELEIYLLSNYSNTTGSYTAVSLSGCTLRVGVGAPGAVIAYTDVFEAADGAAKMSLSLNTEEAGEALEGKTSISTILEVEYISSVGVRQTVLQVQAVLKNDILATDTPAPIQIPLVSTILTQAQAAADLATIKASQTSEDADDARDSEVAAAASATAAEAAKVLTQGALNDAILARDDTQSLRDETESLKGDVEGLRDEANSALNEAQSHADFAEASVASLFAAWNNRGFYDASGNTAPSGTKNAGDFWTISVGGTFGSIAWIAGDVAGWSGTTWQKFPASNLFSSEISDRKQHAGNKETKTALELTSGYLTVPNSAAYLAQLPITYCFTYTKRGNWGDTDNILHHNKDLVRAGFTPSSGVQMIVSNASARTTVRVRLNSSSLDGDSYSQYNFALLPLGTHSVCLVIDSTFSDGTTTSTTLPQKVSLYVDGVQLTPALATRYTTTTGGTTSGPCTYSSDGTGDLYVNALASTPSTSSYRANVAISRLAILNFVLPATASAAVSTYRYSVEQYALGEAIPQKLLLGKNILADCVPMNPSSNTIDPASKGSYSWSGNTCTLTLVSNDDQPSQYNISWTPPSNIPLGAYLYFKVTISATNHAASNTVAFRVSGANSTYFPLSAVVYRDGVQVSTVISSDILYFESVSGTHVYEGYVVTKGNVSEYISKFAVVCNTINATQGWQSGATVTLNDIRVFGAITCLDQPFKGGNQLPDRGLLKLAGALESQTPPLRELITYRDTLKWTGTYDPKAVVSATTNVVPTNTRLVLYAKASTGAPTVAVANGSTTLTASTLLSSTTWTELGSYYYNSAAKLTVQPSAAYDGSIYIMARLEPLT